MRLSIALILGLFIAPSVQADDIYKTDDYELRLVEVATGLDRGHACY